MNYKPQDATPAISTTVLSDDEIRKILIERIDVRHQSVGIVVGIINGERRSVIAQGHLDGGDQRPLNGDTVFEIGSLTKVFTSLLLSDMVQRGEVSLDDPVAKYLPSAVRMPERNGRVITLVDLATHTSGLPRLPGNIAPRNINNPYADYTVEQLYQFLSNYSLTRDIGSEFEYSNLGGGLLGHVLARRADTDYETLVYSRICDPLGMKNTRITLTSEMKAHFAVGHDGGLKPVENWDFPTLAGGGALRSTANDLLTFLAANLGITKSPLSAAMAAMLKIRRPTELTKTERALGWGILKRDGKEIIQHIGMTGGYCSLMGYENKSGVGVVVLSNAAWPVDDIGDHLLYTGFPLSKPPSKHAEAKVDTRIFDAYLGKYQLLPNYIITISSEGDRLFVQTTWQGKCEIFPESDHHYFLKVIDTQIIFVMGCNGMATELFLHNNDVFQQAKRIE